MQYEKSCGAVIYTVQNGTRFYLVEQMQKGHVSLCKGHVEKDETELQTAEREIREETGLDVEFVEGFRKTIAYSPRMDCMKTVVLFLAYAEHTDARAQEEEVRAIQWLPFENAVEALTFDRPVKYCGRQMRFWMGENDSLCVTTGDTSQLDESSADHVWFQIRRRTAFLSFSLCKRTLFKTRIGTSNGQCIL